MIILSIFLIVFSLSEYNGFTKEKTNLLKAILPFLVIASHYFPISFFETDISLLGCYAVSIFFFISGYGLTCKYNKGGSLSIKYVASKIFSLLIPLVTSGIMYSLVVYYYKDINVWKDFGKNLLNGYFLFPISWFVCKLIVLYFVFYIDSQFNNVKIFLSILFLTSLSCMIAERLLGIQATYYMSDLAFAGGALFFYMERKRAINIKLTKVAYIIIVTILLLQVKGSIYFTSLLLPIVTVPIFCCIKLKENRVTRFFSEISYELYLIQVTAAAIVSNYMQGIFAFLCIVIISIILAYILSVIDSQISQRVQYLLFQKNSTENTRHA